MAAGEAGGCIQSGSAEYSDLSACCRYPIGIHFFCAEYPRVPQVNPGIILRGWTSRIRLAACERQESRSAFGQIVGPIGRQMLQDIERSGTKDARLVCLASAT